MYLDPFTEPGPQLTHVVMLGSSRLVPLGLTAVLKWSATGQPYVNSRLGRVPLEAGEWREPTETEMATMEGR